MVRGEHILMRLRGIVMREYVANVVVREAYVPFLSMQCHSIKIVK